MIGNTGPSTVREQGNITLQCPKLTETNYSSWTILVETVLRAHGLWKTVTGEDEDEKRNYTTKAIIYPTLPEDVLLQVAKYKNAEEVWESIRIRYLGTDRVQKARLQTLRGDLERLKMKDNEPIDDFSGKLGAIVEKFKSLVNNGMVKAVDAKEDVEGTMKEVEEAEEEEEVERPPDHHLHRLPDHRRTTVGPPSVHHLHPSAHWTTDAPPPYHRRTTTVSEIRMTLIYDADAEADEEMLTKDKYLNMDPYNWKTYAYTKLSINNYLFQALVMHPNLLRTLVRQLYHLEANL
ncbi:hypothetical protein LXL04_007072 [Taraxacum kok-saghyz]